MIKLIHKITNCGGAEVTVDRWSFPGGECGVCINDRSILPRGLDHKDWFIIKCIFQSNDDLIDMLLLHDAVRRLYPNNPVGLEIPYFPYARQDRVVNRGESLSVYVIAKLIRSCGFNSIVVMDPHSDVLAGLFEPGELTIHTQDRMFLDILWHKYGLASNIALVAPDAGAAKKIYKLAEALGVPVIECSKQRHSSTGKILGVTIPPYDLDGIQTLVVVDDICDGGATFIELAKEFKKLYNEGTPKMVLAVTHGIFSRGRDVLLEHYAEIICINSLERVIKS